MDKKLKSKEHSNYIDIFFPNGMILDDSLDFLQKENLSDSNKKNNLIENILKNNSLEDNNFIKRMKKCIPNRYNKFQSITNNEYEKLKREFNLK